MSTPTSQAAHPVNKSRFLINRNYRYLFTGRAISLLGDQVSTYTIILWIVTLIAPGQAWAPLAISAVLIASMIPNLLIGPLAGVFVDRWNHRVTMMRMDALRSLFSFLLVAFTGVIPLPFFANGRPSQLVQLVVICTITFLNSTCSQFFNPASMGILASIVLKEDRPQAAGLGQTMQAFATIFGPPLAAPLLFAFGVQWALLLDACSFVVSLLTIWAIQAPAKPSKRSPQSNLRDEFINGLRFSFSNRAIRTIIIASFIATFGAGAFDALYVFFLPGNLHVSSTFTGIVAAALGVGMIGGAFAAAKIARQVGLERLLYFSLLGLGLCLIVLSRQEIFLPALALFFLFGTLLASIRVATSPMLLNETPPEMLGRVFAVINPTSILASLISVSLSGYIASILLGRLHLHILGTTFGPIDTIFAGVGLLFLLSGFYTYRSLSRKRYEQEEQVS